jgi:ParB family chromosome partitioning protein
MKTKTTSTLDFLNTLKAPQRQIVELPIASIEADPNQPRSAFNGMDGIVAQEEIEALEEMASDIAENTQLQPILVKEIGDGRYQIIAGERRWRAIQLNHTRGVPNSETIQVIIRQDLSDVKLRLTQLSENMHRRDLSEIEIATFLKTILEAYPELQKTNIAKLLKRNNSYINRILALVDPRWADVVHTGIITYSSLLEHFKTLPEYKRDELKKKAVEENRKLTSGDITRARKEYKKGLVPPEIPEAVSAAEAMSKLGLGNRSEDDNDVDLANAVQDVIDADTLEDENYQPNNTALALAQKIMDDGEDLHISPFDEYDSASLGKCEVKLTVNQLFALYATTDVSDSYIVSMMLPVEDLRRVIQHLEGDVPEDDSQLVLTLIQLLNKKKKQKPR